MRAIDLFAGAGGFSEGARQAGAQIVWAGNHWGAAVQVHAQNHPETIHVCQDLHQANWMEVPEFDLLLGSPCCQGHSRARGVDRPHHDAARSTAWAMVSAAEAHRPAAFVLENVPEYMDWVLFPAWKAAMAALGYKISHAMLDAQYFQVPQERKRIFIVGMKRKAFTFPTTQPFKDLVPVSTVLDLEGGDWFPIGDKQRASIGKKPLAVNSKARIAAGRARFGNRPFWTPYFGSNIQGYGIDRPIWCITTRDRYRLVLGDMTRILNANEVRAIMGFPDDYQMTGKAKLDKHLFGNAVCPPVSKWIVKEVMEAA